MKLGAFSVSLAVKSLEKSKKFYGAIGFLVVGGNAEQGWLILRNAGQTIGLFEGMFEANILTFNPGWNEEGKQLDHFTDVRELHKRFTAQGLRILQETIPNETGPASFSLEDPDGNSILIDQHV